MQSGDAAIVHVGMHKSSGCNAVQAITGEALVPMSIGEHWGCSLVYHKHTKLCLHHNTITHSCLPWRSGALNCTIWACAVAIPLLQAQMA